MMSVYFVWKIIVSYYVNTFVIINAVQTASKAIQAS